MLKCDICGVENETVSREISRKTLIMGPFRTPSGLMPTYENRCRKCEKELIKKINKMIERICDDSPVNS